MTFFTWRSLARRRLLAALAALWMTCCAIAPVAAAIVQERSVKAAFLAKFFAYVDFGAAAPEIARARGGRVDAGANQPNLVNFRVNIEAS